MIKIPRYLIAFIFVFISGAANSSNQLVSRKVHSYINGWDSAWSSDSPLPSVYFSGQSSCKPQGDILGDSDHADLFLVAISIFSRIPDSVNVGLCLLNAGNAEAAKGYFSLSSQQFELGVESIVSSQQMALNENRLNQAVQQQKIKDASDLKESARVIGGLISQINQIKNGQNLSSTISKSDPNRLSAPELLSMYGSIQDLTIRSAADSVLRLQKEYNDIKFEISRLNLSKEDTIRIPIVPMGGFTRLIVKLANGCTGAFVGPKTVLTNYHCSNFKDNDRFITRSTPFSNERFTIVSILKPFSEPYDDKNANHRSSDWTLLTVAEDRSDANNFFKVAPSTPSDIKSVMIAGFSADYNSGRFMTLDVNCPYKNETVLKQRNDALHEYLCSTTGGSSGAPVFDIQNPTIIIGLNARSQDRLSDGRVIIRNTEEGKQLSRNNRKKTFFVPTERFSEQVFTVSPLSKPTERQLAMRISDYTGKIEKKTANFANTNNSNRKLLQANPDLD